MIKDIYNIGQNDEPFCLAFRMYGGDRMNRYKVGEQAFIIESNRRIRSIVITKVNSGFYTVKFNDKDGAISLKESRIFVNIEEAEHVCGIRVSYPQNLTPRPPHKIW